MVNGVKLHRDDGLCYLCLKRPAADCGAFRAEDGLCRVCITDPGAYWEEKGLNATERLVAFAAGFLTAALVVLIGRAIQQ